MPVNNDRLRTLTVIGFEYDYDLNDRITVSFLGNVPGGIEIKISKYEPAYPPDGERDCHHSEHIVIPKVHMETFIDFLKIALEKLNKDEERAKKFRNEG